MRTLLLTFSLIALSLVSYSQKERALIIIDIQDFYFPGGDAELVNPEKAADNAFKVLEHFRKNGGPVIHVRHNYEPGGNIHQTVAPEEGEKVFSKDFANSFRDTGLLEYLRKNNIKEVVIAGMQTHMCVEATTRAAADKGFRCTVISDACTTRNLKYGDKTINWDDVHYSTLSTLKGSYATIMNASEFIEAN